MEDRDDSILHPVGRALLKLTFLKTALNSEFLTLPKRMQMADRYRLSFTTGGLFVQEAASVAAAYLSTKDWVKARAQARQENLLQVRTASAATRVSKELTARLEHLDDMELKSLINFNLHDRASLLWVAACRNYDFIREFATDVLRENHLQMRRQLTFNDYESFYSSKALWHAELDQLAVSTQRKLRQNLFRMLREADLLSDSDLILPASLSPGLTTILARQGRRDLLVFPATEKELQRWLQ